MTEGLHEAICTLQRDDQAHAQQAFAAVVGMALRDPVECAAELSRAVSEEQAAGGLRTPRLLTLLGLTRVPVPECLPICLDLLRVLAATETPPPSDAALGAAAIVVRTQPRALLPDLACERANPQAAAVDRDIVRALMLLLSITRELLHNLPDNAVADMARWLWYDCAKLDLTMLADVAGLHVRESGGDDPLVRLMLDLVERVPATADQKRYAGDILQEAGVGAAAVEQFQTAWRAISVAPAPDPATILPPPVVDPEPPPPEPRVDEWLAAFSEGDDGGIELAGAAIDMMFEEMHPPVALAWWLTVTVDALPPWRRRTDIEWALVQVATALRRHGDRMSMVPPSLLQRWLDTPQLLDPMASQLALDLLGRQQPGAVLRRCLHRAVAASCGRHPEMVMGGMWRALAAAEPSAVLLVASRWIAFGFGKTAFLELLVDLLSERASAQPALIDALGNVLAPTPNTPADVIDIARKLLDALRNPPPGDRQP